MFFIELTLNYSSYNVLLYNSFIFPFFTHLSQLVKIDVRKIVRSPFCHLPHLAKSGVLWCARTGTPFAYDFECGGGLLFEHEPFVVAGARAAMQQAVALLVGGPENLDGRERLSILCKSFLFGKNKLWLQAQLGESHTCSEERHLSSLGDMRLRLEARSWLMAFSILRSSPILLMTSSSGKKFQPSLREFQWLLLLLLLLLLPKGCCCRRGCCC
jgi:hypothetical protein